MGTRSLIAVVVNDEPKIAQYSQWDGYPDGQGKTVLEFLTNLVQNAREQEFINRLNECSWITEEQLDERWDSVGADTSSNGGWVSYEISKEFSKRYPENSRDTGAKILSIVLESKEPVLLANAMDFGTDKMFCEYAYVVDMSKRVLEFYCGMSDKPSRFGKDGIALCHKIKFDEIVAKGVDAILKRMNRNE